MSDLAVLVLPPGPLQAIRATLHDWVVLGVARRHVVVAQGAISGSATPAVLVDEDGLDGANLQTIIAQLNPTDVIRFLVIEEVGSESADDDAQALAELIERTSNARLQRLRVFVKRSGQSAAPRGQEGWDNILISAEDSTGPGAAAGALPETLTGDSVAIFETPFVAALAGLFRDQRSAPFDDRSQLPDGQIMAGRVFIRRLETSAVEQALREAVLDMSKGLPLPFEQGVQATYVDDVDLANQDMAEALWKKYEELFASHRRVLPETRATEIGVWEALKHFFSFLLSLTRSAPRAWVAGLLHRGKIGVAKGVRGFVYGPAATVVVTFGGVRIGDGAPTAQEFLTALRDADSELAELSRGRREHVAHVDTSRLWRDYVGGALTLADGKTRVEDLPAIRIGSRAGIVRNGAQIAASTGETFHVRDGAVAAQLPAAHIAPSDLLEAQNLRGHLRSLSTESLYGVQASHELERLNDWFETQRATYSGQLLFRIASEILERSNEVKMLQDLIKRVLDDSAELDRLSQQAVRVRRKVWLFTGLGLLTALGAAAAYIFGAISVLMAVIVAAVGGLFGFLASFAVYYKGQVDLWRRAAQLREDLDMLGAAQDNIVSAIRDMRRLGDAYQLGLLWARALGTFMERPLPNRTRHARSVDNVATPQPLSVAVGAAQADGLTAAQAALELRRRVFTPGWMNHAWSSFLASAAEQMGEDGAVLVNQPELMYEQTSASEDDLLERWVDVLEEQGSVSPGAEKIWMKCVQQLTTDRDALLRPLLASVRTTSAGRQTVVPEHVFMAPISTQAPLATIAPFSFTDHGLQDGASRVGWRWVSDEQEHAHLGRLGILMEFTAGSQPYHFGQHADDQPDWEGLSGV